MTDKPWKKRVNAALMRSAGVRLTTESPDQRQGALAAAEHRGAERVRARKDAQLKRTRTKLREVRAQRTRQQARAQRQRERADELQREARELRREQSRLRRKLSSDDLLDSYDEKVRETVELVRPRTMTDTAKLVPLIECVRYVVRHGVPGEVVECGVWRGGSMQAAAYTLLSLDAADRELHLFDTFEGMPPPTEEDTRQGGRVSAAELLAVADKDSRMWAIAGLDDVRTGMDETGYPGHLVHLHAGMVEDTIPAQAPDQIAVLRLDTDWYESTKHELEHLYTRLSPGGVLLLDDYGDWEGARKATDEWLEETGEPLLLLPMGSGRIAIKPWTGAEPSPAGSRDVAD